MEPLVLLEVADGIAEILLNRPHQLNALNLELNQLLYSTIQEIKKDSSIRAVVISGAGTRAFAAGADITDMVDADPVKAHEVCQLAIKINDEIENLQIPTIAAICGFAFGGGFELALACDFRVGGPRTLLSFPEVGLGVIPGANGCVRAASLLGPSIAKQLILLNEKISGKAAFDMGLLNWFEPGSSELDKASAEAKASLESAKRENNGNLEKMKLLYSECESAAAAAEADAICQKASAVAARLIQMPGKAVAAAKNTINFSVKEGMTYGKERETVEFTELFKTHDQKEGMRAMLEKRKPIFQHN